MREEARARTEKDAARRAAREAAGLLSRAETFEAARAEIRRMIIARPVERIGINHDYKAGIKFRISVDLFMRIVAQGSEKMCSPGKWSTLWLLICRIIKTCSESSLSEGRVLWYSECVKTRRPGA